MLDYPCTLIEGFVLLNCENNIGETSLEIYRLLNNIDSKKIGLIIPITCKELKYDPDKKIQVEIAKEILGKMIDEINCDYIKGGEQLISYEDMVIKLKEKVSNRKM